MRPTPTTLVRLALLACVATLTFCVRTIVTHPGVAVAVVDARGKPVPRAKVTLYWWSYPHKRIRRKTTLHADDKGRLVLYERRDIERVAPFCMHGVPEHHFTFCAAKAGVGVAVLGWRQAGPRSLELKLSAGDVSLCDRFTDVYFRTIEAAPAKPRK